MGSLRNPVGPLPSSIYWRRRAVLAAVVALLTLLATWAVTSGGGGGNGQENGANGKNPASTITPGPSGSGPAISQAPGGRDESEGGGSGDSGGSGGSGNSGGSGASGDADGSGDGGKGDGDAGSGGAGGVGTGVGTGSGDTVPAGSSLPNCTPGAVKLSLRSVRNTYEAGQTPAFVLAARNTSGSDCKVDLGPERAVLTITQAAGDDAFWASDHCPKGTGSRLYRVPAGSGVTYTVKWDRRASAPECATPSAGRAGAGTYLVEAKVAGFAKVQTSFVLEAD